MVYIHISFLLALILKSLSYSYLVTAIVADLTSKDISPLVPLPPLSLQIRLLPFPLDIPISQYKPAHTSTLRLALVII